MDKIVYINQTVEDIPSGTDDLKLIKEDKTFLYLFIILLVLFIIYIIFVARRDKFKSLDERRNEYE